MERDGLRIGNSSQSQLRERVAGTLAEGISEGRFTAAVARAQLDGEVLVHTALGDAMVYEAGGKRSSNPIPVAETTLFDAASITKLFTAMCVMQLVEERRLELDRPVAKYLPEFAAEGKGDRTVRQLLTHVAGLPPFEHLWEYGNTRSDYIGRTLRVKPSAPACETYVYSDIGLITLGLLIESLDGRPLDASVQTRICEPLGLSRTCFNPLRKFPREEIAATEDESYLDRGMVWGEVHDENAWCLGGAAGHAGIFSTASDLALFAQSFLDGGRYDGHAILQPETIAEMTRNQIGDLGSRGLGWQMDAEFYMGKFSAVTTYGHTGFTGTSLFIEPHSRLVAVLLTNRVHPTRNGPDLTPTRRAFADALYDAVS